MPISGEAQRKTYTRHQSISRDVVVAFHEILGQNCIQKTYAPTGREDAIAFAEPRLLDELVHPHITPIKDAQFDPQRPGSVTIIMRAYGGGSIHDSMTKAAHHFSVASVTSILGQLSDAFNYLHVEKRYVHRDTKPKNILLDKDRATAYLADFGSAALLDPSTGRSAAIRATPIYQAPEAALTGTVGPAADIYALGLTVFEMLNGLFPYASLNGADVDHRISTGKRALPDRMLAPGAFAPHVPGALRTLTRSMYNADPAQRPTAAELLRSLHRLALIDWGPSAGDGLDDEWRGSWLPNGRAEQRIDLRIDSKILHGGADRGRRRLTAQYLSTTSGGWRTVVAPATVDGQDSAAVSAFFKQVDAEVARRWPA